MRNAARRVASVALALVVGACAAGRRDSKEPQAAQSPAMESSGTAASQYPPARDYPAQAPKGYPESTVPQPLPGQAPPPPPATPGASPQGGAQPIAPGRTAALARAGSDFDAAQRELDVAAGDCRNACRALGSMDRAAGHLCELAQASEESRRCEDARRKVLSARERVKQTCGGCPGGPSVERNDPIPSTR